MDAGTMLVLVTVALDIATRLEAVSRILDLSLFCDRSSSLITWLLGSVVLEFVVLRPVCSSLPNAAWYTTPCELAGTRTGTLVMKLLLMDFTLTSNWDLWAVVACKEGAWLLSWSVVTPFI